MRAPAKVAKVKSSYHHAQTYSSAWRRQLRHMAKWMLITIGLLMMLALVIAGLSISQGQRRVDCTTATWHDDVPPAAKNQCRRNAVAYQFSFFQPRSTS